MYLIITILVVAIATFQISVLGQCLSKNDDTNYPHTIQENLHKSQRIFGISLLKSIQEKTPNDNIFCSPYSTYQSLLLTYFGAEDITEEELKKVLNLDWVQNKNHVLHGFNLEKNLHLERQKDSSITFTSADKIFFSNHAKLQECMSNILKDEIETKDFRSNPEQSRKDINNWISNVTHGEIEEILSEGDITAQTNMVISNGAYFHGLWEIKFNSNLTEKEIFHISTDKRYLVEMMHIKDTFRVSYNDQYKVHILELPYVTKNKNKEPEISMIILLPPFIQGINDVLANLTADNLEMMLKQTSPREIEVSLPKFEFKSDITLTPVLKDMGLRNIFGSKSNLNRFSSETNLSIDEAKHMAKIKVDEEGSIAAAATVMFSFRSARPLDPAKFECNRPFIFIIYDHKSNTLLFTGIYRDPTLLK